MCVLGSLVYVTYFVLVFTTHVYSQVERAPVTPTSAASSSATATTSNTSASTASTLTSPTTSVVATAAHPDDLQYTDPLFRLDRPEKFVRRALPAAHQGLPCHPALAEGAMPTWFKPDELTGFERINSGHSSDVYVCFAVVVLVNVFV